MAVHLYLSVTPLTVNYPLLIEMNGVSTRTKISPTLVSVTWRNMFWLTLCTVYVFLSGGFAARIFLSCIMFIETQMAV
jgi:hypothetical protein